MNKANTLNKILLGAGIVGAIYLTSCVQKNSVVSKDNIIEEKTDSTTKITTYTTTGNISLESTKLLWNNVRLVGKDEGFINCRISSDDAKYGNTYVYSEYLFKGPTGEEIALFGREETLFVGENYNIEFYKLKPDTKITSRMILQTLEDTTYWVNFNKNISKELEGILNKYERVTK
jgi:hypothetical protein